MTIFAPPAAPVSLMETTAAPAPVAPLDEPEAAPETAGATPAAQVIAEIELEAAPAETEPEAEDNDAVEPETDTAAKTAPAKSAMKKSTRLEYTIENEPYDFAKCSITVSLTLRPDDGHIDGRPVVVGVRSHTEPPILRMARLNKLSLPPEIGELLAQYQNELPRRGAAKAEAKAKEEEKEKAAAEKRKQTTTARQVKPNQPAVKTPIQPAKPEKPKPAPVSLTPSLF